MKKVLFLVPALLLTVSTLTAQTPQNLKKVMELQMPKTADDDMPGTRGASVVWHPVQKKYYASFAGNIGYPMGVFDIKGKRLSSDELVTNMDTRGLWYNPATKLITGNGYGDAGWFSYKMDKDGIPGEEITHILEDDMYQPGDQSVGTYNTVTKQVIFLFLGQVFMYKADGSVADSVAIHWGRKKADGPADNEDIHESSEDYNSTSVIYTGVKGQEIGLLNITNKEIELYDIKTGYLTKKLALPETALAETVFNFAYANGIYWLFNMELRKWSGYK